MVQQPLWALASFSVSWSILQSAGLLEWVISSSQGLYRNFGREMADNFAQRPPWVKQLEVPYEGLVPWSFPSLKIRRPPPGLNPRRSSHEVGTLPLDYGGRCYKTADTRKPCGNASVTRLAYSVARKLSFFVFPWVALPFPQFCAAPFSNTWSAQLITILGNCGCVAVASFLGVLSP
jgi:hypothetical protein